MKMIIRKGLAVCMAATLILSGFTVSAEESAQTENRDAVESVATVSGGDVDKSAEDLGEMGATVNLAEDQIMPLAADDIASGTDGDITWVIDASGKLKVEGTGDLSGDHFSSDFAWSPYCEQIISAEFNVTGMTDASWLFDDCKNMISIDISGFDTSNVTDMRSMFYGCSSLTDLDVSGFETANVTDMRHMFYGCNSLTDLDVSGFETANVTDMGWMFYGCTENWSLKKPRSTN